MSLTTPGDAIDAPPRRSAPFEEEPGFYEPAGLWLYGNVRLLGGELRQLAGICATEVPIPEVLNAIERLSEEIVLSGKILVCGVHNDCYQQSAVVPLRWGCPRIVVFSGGFHHHLGQNLKDEPFRAARLWRYQWDSKTDLAVSRRAPDAKLTFARHNPTVDRLITQIGEGLRVGLLSPFNPSVLYVG